MEVKKICSRCKLYCYLYCILLTNFFKIRMLHRSDFIIGFVGIVMSNSVVLLMLNIVFKSISDIGGWGYNDIVLLAGFSILCYVPTQLCAEKLWSLGGDLNSGNFIKYSLRPINILFYYLSQSMDLKAIGQVLSGILLVAHALNGLDISLGLIDIIIVILMYVSSALMIFSVLLLANALGFWVTYPSAAMMFVVKLRDYANYPLTIFPGWLQIFFTWIIPIGFFSYYPVGVILNKPLMPFVGLIAVALSLTVFCVSYRIWIYGATRYNATGS